MRQRGEKLERWSQYLYDRGGMRRVHLGGREDILKRLVVHSAAAKARHEVFKGTYDHVRCYPRNDAFFVAPV